MKEFVKTEELHRLMGITASALEPSTQELVKSYIQAGNINRFDRKSVAGGRRRGGSSSAGTSIDASDQAEWLDQEGLDAEIRRRIIQVNKQERNRALAAKLRILYSNCCMFCGRKLQVGDNQFYSEAAHIKPLGLPHRGPDKTGNLLVLCPNHHLQFDRGMLTLAIDGKSVSVVSKIAGDSLGGVALNLKHELDHACVQWHADWVCGKR